MASCYGKEDIVELLISAGANLHIANEVSIIIELAHAVDIIMDMAKLGGGA